MNDETGFEVKAAGERGLVIQRLFRARRVRVYEALTRAAELKQWFDGPAGWELVECEADVREGGGYRFAWRDEARGIGMGMGGRYVEVVEGERLVHTEKFDEAWYPGEAVVRTMLTEEGGWTRLRAEVEYESREARDMVLASPMEEGVRQTYNRLAEHLGRAAGGRE